ncbi:MAG: S8 family serine peptidase, partial [Bacteroidota bacterium]
MKRAVLPVLFLLCLTGWLQAQRPYVGQALREALQAANAPLARSATPLDLLIVFEEQVDFKALKKAMDAEGLNARERPRRVMRACMQLAEKSQGALEATLRDAGQDRPLKRHWIVNAVVVRTDAQTATALTERRDIRWMDLDTAWKARVLPPSSALPSPASPNGREPGLTAINAPALWAMGYTGKNRISYNIDTGVWPEHPAFSDRFLANFYPMSQAWYAYDFPIPADKSGSHGTHTLGTALGLEKATNDTIGVAFNAYWIASDPVATSLATVKPLSDFMFAFEWGMNPDGDTTTSHDVPDVINNSWGYDSPGDTALCTNSFVSQMMDAIEAAGI